MQLPELRKKNRKNKTIEFSLYSSSYIIKDLNRLIPDFRQTHPERRRHIIPDEIRISDIDFDTES